MSPCGIHYITFRDHRRVWPTKGLSHGKIYFGKLWYVPFAHFVKLLRGTAAHLSNVCDASL